MFQKLIIVKAIQKTTVLNMFTTWTKFNLYYQFDYGSCTVHKSQNCSK